MRFLIVGCGSIGKRHAENLIALGHEVAAYNRGAKRRKEIQKKLGIKVYKNLEEMFRCEKANAAIICSPNSMHIKHATTAAENNLNLFIEKPLSQSLNGINELEKLVEAHRLIGHVAANMRFHFGPAYIKEIMLKKELGQPLWAHIWGGMHLPDWHPNEDYRNMYSAKTEMGGGVVLDFIHELDLLLWIFGDPCLIAAMTSKSGWLEIETEDIVDVILQYHGGLQINMHLDYLQRPFQRGIKVVCEKGWIKWDLACEQVECFYHYTQQNDISPYPKGYKHNDMYVDQMKYFINCLKKGSMSDSNIATGRRALELALWIKESSNKRTFINEDQTC